MAKDRSFVNRRLHSLLGVVPIGLFLIEHLITNFAATKGPEAFQKAVAFIQGLPFVFFLELFLIWIPILFHAVYGVYIAFQTRNNPVQYGFYRNVMFALQRYTGLITFVYIAWHVWETRVQVALGAEVNFDMMASILSSPFMLAFYIVGVVATIFHFSNGVWGFLIHWGIIIGPRAQKVASLICIAIFVILTTIGLAALFAFAFPSSAAALL